MPFNLTRLIVQERFLKFTKEDMQEIAVSCYEDGKKLIFFGK